MPLRRKRILVGGATGCKALRQEWGAHGTCCKNRFKAFWLESRDVRPDGTGRSIVCKAFILEEKEGRGGGRRRKTIYNYYSGPGTLPVLSLFLIGP